MSRTLLATLAGLDDPARAGEVLHRGGNSTVVLLAEEGLVAKFYVAREGDERDRVGTEFRAMRFLWEHGVQDIPEPIDMDAERRIGLYRYVEGERLHAGQVTREDVDHAADFVLAIQHRRGLAEARGFPPASEARFTLRGHVDLLDGRLTRLLNAVDRDSEVARFLTDDVAVCLSRASVCAADWTAVLSAAERILSPSDFGLYNALRREDGRLVFLDFEYFGWDDPAKLISDALLQPDVPVPVEHRKVFLHRIWGGLGLPPGLPRRIERLYPLLAIKWAMILMNPFLPDRRRPGDEGLLAARLAKARASIAETRRAMEEGVLP